MRIFRYPAECLVVQFNTFNGMWHWQLYANLVAGEYKRTVTGLAAETLYLHIFYLEYHVSNKV